MTDSTQPKNLTHANGAPVTDNFNILTDGPRGPAGRVQPGAVWLAQLALVLFGVMIVVLLVRPTGLFGRKG